MLRASHQIYLIIIGPYEGERCFLSNKPITAFAYDDGSSDQGEREPNQKKFDQEERNQKMFIRGVWSWIL